MLIGRVTCHIWPRLARANWSRYLSHLVQACPAKWRHIFCKLIINSARVLSEQSDVIGGIPLNSKWGSITTNTNNTIIIYCKHVFLPALSMWTVLHRTQLSALDIATKILKSVFIYYVRLRVVIFLKEHCSVGECLTLKAVTHFIGSDTHVKWVILTTASLVNSVFVISI
jgi:hypothetical protein